MATGSCWTGESGAPLRRDAAGRAPPAVRGRWLAALGGGAFLASADVLVLRDGALRSTHELEEGSGRRQGAVDWVPAGRGELLEGNLREESAVGPGVDQEAQGGRRGHWQGVQGSPGKTYLRRRGVAAHRAIPGTALCMVGGAEPEYMLPIPAGGGHGARAHTGSHSGATHEGSTAGE